MEIKERNVEKSSLKGYIIGIVVSAVFLLFGVALVLAAVIELRNSDDVGSIIILIFGIIWSALFVFVIYAIIVNAKHKILTDKQNEGKKEIYFESPYGTFWYISVPDQGEYGYECEIDWNDSGEKEDTVYIDTDTPENKEARLCFERFERIYSDKERFDSNVKNRIADFILSHPDLFSNAPDRGTIISYMELSWFGIRRNGDIECSFDGCLNAANIHLLIREDGTKEIEYDDNNEMCHKKFSI